MPHSSSPSRPPSSSRLFGSTRPPAASRLLTVSVAALAVLGLAACAAPEANPEPDAAARPHGYVEGATEETEPQLHFATVDASGRLALLDLLSESSSDITTLSGTTGIATDGRFVFASSPAGLTIVDTGVWTVDHEDHSHYYRAEPSVLGTLEGGGPATVVGGASRTGVWFGKTGTGVVLDSGALGTGTIEELARIEGEPHDGAIVPLGDRLLVTDAAGSVRVHDADGDPLDTVADCSGFSGTIATRVGRILVCEQGVLLATETASTGTASTETAGTETANTGIAFETIAYPEGVAAEQRATEFRGRPGRPTVAAVAGTTGAWLLDTRERTWTLLPTEAPLLLVAAADDRDGNVVALAADGRVLVLDPVSGATVAATGPLLADTVAAASADPALLAGLELTVDSTRAYLNAPVEGLVYEIDYADGARVARTFAVAGSPLLLAETGR